MDVFINLYQPLHPKTIERLSGKNILIVYGVFILILSAVYGYGNLEKRQVSLKLEQTEKHRVRTEKELARVQQEYSNEAEVIELTNKLNTIERDLDSKRQALQFLSDKMLTNVHGFSEYLVAIAQQSREGLWLESIKLSEGGEQIELKGKAQRPEFLFQYLQRLGSGPPLKGKAFNAFSLSKTTDDGRALQFFLGTIEEENKIPETTNETGNK